MVIPFINSLLRVSSKPNQLMTTPLRPTEARPLILKLDAKQYRLDPFREELIGAGFQVVRGASLAEGLKLARRARPDLCLVFDNPKAGVDGQAWLSLQHSDVEAMLATVPLIIVAERKRMVGLRPHELPGRVKVVSAPVEMTQLIPTITQLLDAANF